MKARWWMAAPACALLTFAAAAGDYPFVPAEMTNVVVKGGFWLSRFETNRQVTLKTCFDKCEDARIPNFREAAARKLGTFKGIPFDDSDVYKVIEGAAYILASHPDKELEKYVDGVNAAISGAQERDGYLYTARTLGHRDWLTGTTRWSNCSHGHELYNVGHLYEAAVAYRNATGKSRLLETAIKSADLVDRTFGPGKTQLKDVPGHEEIEIALCKLYRSTGDARYLKLAKHFIDRRGHGVKAKNGMVFAQNGSLIQADVAPNAYNQNHLPVVEQREAVGHSVRAMYLYCGMADVAALTEAPGYLEALDALWENVVSKKMAINGSVGARRSGEAFGANYELPNETAYLETCAGIGHALWNWRMFLLYGDAKYMDVLERAIYNGILSGVSLGGDEFFYPNPLASKGGYKRKKWFGCSCCPVNMVRFIPQVTQFAYATSKNTAYVNLFVESDAKLNLECGTVALSQKTEYPWSGTVRIGVTPPRDGAKFSLNVRVPGWCVGRPVPSDLYEQVVPGTPDDFRLKVNGQAVKFAPVKGYAVLEREWKKGDVIEMTMNMPVRRVKAHASVKADQGRLAVEQGPIVFCAEGIDNGGRAFSAYMPYDATFVSGRIDIGGVAFPTLKSSNGVTLVPYCIWGNRQPGNEMQTWFPAEPPPVEVSASYCYGNDSVLAILDGIVPKISGDLSVPRHTFWSHRGTDEWVQFDFPKAKSVRGVEVFWFDDSGNGACRVPESWKVQWRESHDSQWRDIEGAAPVHKDGFCTKDFPAPVKAQALRLCVKLQPKFSGGILEWRVKE